MIEPDAKLILDADLEQPLKIHWNSDEIHAEGDEEEQLMYSGKKISEEAEKLSKAPYTRTSTNKSDMTTKEAAYFEKGFAAAISQIKQEFKYKEESGDK